jgi:hypothetical protein
MLLRSWGHIEPHENPMKNRASLTRQAMYNPGLFSPRQESKDASKVNREQKAQESGNRT